MSPSHRNYPRHRSYIGWMYKHSVGRVLAEENEALLLAENPLLLVAPQQLRMQASKPGLDYLVSPETRAAFHAWRPAHDGHGGFAPRRSKEPTR